MDRMTMYYECSICQSLNHASRLHCRCCGTIPARYSVLRVPVNDSLTPVVVAYGCRRASQHIPSRVFFRTVPTDYYAEV